MEGWWRIVLREKAQEELHRRAADLEAANRKLKELNRLAEAATRAKSEFLANMTTKSARP